jgi:hypothetical protein
MTRGGRTPDAAARHRFNVEVEKLPKNFYVIEIA